MTVSDEILERTCVAYAAPQDWEGFSEAFKNAVRRKMRESLSASGLVEALNEAHDTLQAVANGDGRDFGLTQQVSGRVNTALANLRALTQAPREGGAG